VNAEELLTIDTEAELTRKLGAAWTDTPWQVPAELVRRAFACGAGRVEVELGRGRLVVRDDGHGLAPERRSALRRVLDASLSTSERHAALAALETEPELLAIAALQPREVAFDEGDGGGTVLHISGISLEVEQARRYLEQATRFADGEVVVDGERLASGFPDAIAEAFLESPLRGRVAITPDADVAHLWLLSSGVVSSHVTLPRAPAFEAAVEMTALTQSRTPAALREALEPHHRTVVDRAVQLMLETMERASSLDEAARRTVRAQLLIAARTGWRRSEVFRVPLLPAVLGPAGDQRRVLNLLDLGHDRTLPYLEPGEDPHRFRLPEGPVLEIGADERGRLAHLLHMRFRPVEDRQVPPAWRLRARRTVLGMSSALKAAASRMRDSGGGDPLPGTALSIDEREFLRALRPALAPGAPEVAFTDGSGAPHREGDALRLPRCNPEVAAAVRIVARDPRWAYVAALSLSLEPGPEAAQAWRSLSIPDPR
jgi:hypothetical protein